MTAAATEGARMPDANAETPAVAAELAVPETQPAQAAEDGTEDEAKTWPHQWVEFLGDRLGVRKPTQQALAGFSLASSKFIAADIKNDIVGLFIYQHLSPVSYDRVFSRLIDPDEPDYTVDTIGELMRIIVELQTGTMESAADQSPAKSG